MDRTTSADAIDVQVIKGAAQNDALNCVGTYQFECYDAAGNVKWTEQVKNVFTDQGKKSMLDVYLGNGTVLTPWYFTLITAGTPAATNTYAAPTLTEVTSGVLAARVAAASWNAASGTGSVAKATAATSLPIIGTATITGYMLVAGSSVIGNTAAAGGVLLSAATFTSKSVGASDTLSVTYTLTLT